MSKSFPYEKFLNKDNFYTHEEIENEFGSRLTSSFASSLIIKNEDLFLSYKNSDVLEDTIVIKLKDEKKVNKKLIHDSLTDEGMYRYIQTNLDNSLGIILKVHYVIDSSSYDSIILTRAEFISAVNQIVDELSQKEKMRFAMIESIARTYSCEQKYSNYTHQVFVDGTIMEVPASTLLKLLTCDEVTFEKFLSGIENFGYDKECLTYSLVDFVSRERILEKYSFPESVNKRYESIRSFSLIDFESLNHNRIKNDIGKDGESVIDKVTLSEELRAFLNDGIDKTYSNLEKVVYYYIKLCEVLSYDENYFSSESTSILSTHESIDNINSLSLNNNQVVKYDFMVAFASILSSLQIAYTLDQNLMAGLPSSGPMLTFRYGEYLISLNTISVPNQSDLVNVKINDEVINLVCTNKNETTKKKFQELLERIYNDVNIKRQKDKTFKESLETYKSAYADKTVSIQERLYVLLLEITRTNLKGIDAIGYEKKIIDNLFGDTNKVVVTYLCKEARNNYLTPVTIISVNDNNEYIYFMVDHDTPSSVIKVTSGELTNILGLGGIYYVSDEKIPGINSSVGEKYVR